MINWPSSSGDFFAWPVTYWNIAQQFVVHKDFLIVKKRVRFLVYPPHKHTHSVWRFRIQHWSAYFRRSCVQNGSMKQRWNVNSILISSWGERSYWIVLQNTQFTKLSIHKVNFYTNILTMWAKTTTNISAKSPSCRTSRHLEIDLIKKFINVMLLEVHGYSCTTCR